MSELALLLDTETSGLLDNLTMRAEKLPHIIEYYGCIADIDTGELREELHLLIKPPRPISQEIIDITTITNEMLEKEPPFAEVAPRILDQLERAPMVIGQNLSFDKEMLDVEFDRNGFKVKWGRCLCTVEQTIFLKGFRLSLEALHEFLFGLKFEGAHRAKVDTLAMLKCVVELRKRELI